MLSKYENFIIFGALVEKLMNIKKTFFLVLFVGGSCVAFQAKAQEGDPIEPEERPGEVVILPDSARQVEPKEAGYDEMRDTQSTTNNLERDHQQPQLNTPFIPIPTPKRSEPAKTTVIEKEKKDTRNDMSFNILYYIFYKFKKVENYD